MGPIEQGSNPVDTPILVERYRRGDQDAARALFNRYVNGLLEVIRTRIHPGLLRRFGPEDVAQSVFRSLFRAVNEDRVTFERSGDLWAWLIQITFNKLASRSSHHLAAMRSVAREVNLPPGETAETFVADARTDAPTAENLVALADELDALFGPPGSPLRSVLDLRLQDFTLSEIGERLGVSHTTVRRRLEKIKQRLEERTR